MTRRLLLSILCLSLLLLPALASAAEAPAPSIVPATEAAPAPAMAQAPSPASPAITAIQAVPQPLFLTGCTASVTCLCGGSTFTLECQGTVCHEGARSVTCDGVRDQCPPIGSCPH